MNTFLVHRCVRQKSNIIGLSAGCFTIYVILAFIPPFLIILIGAVMTIILEMAWLFLAYFIIHALYVRSEEKMREILPKKLRNR